MHPRVDDHRHPPRPTTTPLRTRSALGPDGGAGTLEYIGIVAAAALLVVALVLGLTRFSLGDKVAAALCELTSGLGQGGECTSGPARAAEDYVPPPPCVVSGNGGAWQGSAAFGVQLEGGNTWFVESLGDGRYRLTRTGSLGAGIEGGLGFDASAVVNDNRYGVAIGIGGSVTDQLKFGDVYYASSDDEAWDILHAATSDDVKDGMVGDDWFGRDFADWVTGASDLEQLDAESTFVKVGVSASGEAFATLIDWDASGVVEAGTYEGQTQYSDGRTTDVFTASSSGVTRASGTVGEEWTEFASAVASYGGAVTIEVDRDADGVATAMRLVTLGSAYADTSSTNNGANDPLDYVDYSQTTWQVPLGTTDQRVTAAKLALGLGIEVPGVTQEVGPLDFSTLDYGQTWSDFQETAKSDGYTWVQDYAIDASTNGGNLDVEALIKVGLSGDYTSTTRHATGYSYWDGAGFVERAGCLEQ